MVAQAVVVNARCSLESMSKKKRMNQIKKINHMVMFGSLIFDENFDYVEMMFSLFR
jgi:hypothetical protein